MRDDQWKSSDPTPGRIAVAAVQTANGDKDFAIAKRLGISVRTLARWRYHPEYQAAGEALNLFQRMHSDVGDFYKSYGEIDYLIELLIRRPNSDRKVDS